MIRQFQRPLESPLRFAAGSSRVSLRSENGFLRPGRSHGAGASPWRQLPGVSDAEGRRACPYPPRRGHRGGWNRLIADGAAPGLETPKQH